MQLGVVLGFPNTDTLVQTHRRAVKCEPALFTTPPPLQVPAAAKAGAIAPISVTLPKQNTGLGPEKTSFFQALSIGTKITRGTIEIMVSAPAPRGGGTQQSLCCVSKGLSSSPS